MTVEPSDRRELDRRADEASGTYGVDRRGTAERHEMRFLASPALAREADRQARLNLKLGDVEADSPWYTTTYCDTIDRRIYRSAESGSGSLLRLREYHPRRPERALASRRIWIEWKDEGKERSRKQRLIVHPIDIGPFLRGDRVRTGDLDLGPSSIELFSRGLSPVVVTQCRRVAYSSRRDDIRITFDHELTYLVPEGVDPLDPSPMSLGAIVARESGILVELKWQRSLPEWLADLLEALRKDHTDRPPKFVVAMRHVLGPPQARTGTQTA